MENPWIKGYKVALTYSSSELDYVRRLDAELVKKLGRDSVFFDQAEQFRLRLCGANLVSALSTIYYESQIVVAVFGQGYQDSRWCEWEYKYVLWMLFNKGNYNVFLLREEGVEVPKELSLHRCNCKSQNSLKDIAEEIANRVRRLSYSKANFEIYKRGADGADFDIRKKHFRIIFEHLGKNYCYATGKERAESGECIIDITSETISTLIAAKKDLIQFIRVYSHLREIRSLLLQATACEQINSKEYKIDTCNKIKDSCLKLLREFVTQHEEQENIYNLIFILSERLWGLLMHYDESEEHIYTKFCYSVCDYLYDVNDAHLDPNVLATMETLCVYSGNVADSILRANKTIRNETIKNWSQKYLLGGPIPIKDIPKVLKSYLNQLQNDFSILR